MNFPRNNSTPERPHEFFYSNIKICYGRLLPQQWSQWGGEAAIWKIGKSWFFLFHFLISLVCKLHWFSSSKQWSRSRRAGVLLRESWLFRKKRWMVYLIFILQYQIWCLEVILHCLFASSYIQIGTDFVTDRDFAALDFLDHELLGDGKPERPYNETVDYGLEKLVLQF